jgi:alpha-beta hydrolase superfamily lysophospholipase
LKIARAISVILITSILVSVITTTLSTIIISTPIATAAAQTLSTIEKRDVTIDLEPGGGLQTKGELTIPAIGDGPFPAVLLIHGSGATDMDEYLPPMVTGTGNESRPFWQIAEYLSERGFVVLRYDKRGIGENGTILDLNTYANATAQQFQNDAEAALNVLIQQPEADRDKITIIGHSEGAIIAPRIAVERPEDVQNIVLMSAAAQPISEIVSYQLVNRTLFFARQDWDANHDGLLSLEEVFAHPDAPLTIPAISNNDTAANPSNATYSVNDSDENSTTLVATPTPLNITTAIPPQQWVPGVDANKDTLINIDQELLPFRLAQLAEFEAIPWFQSHEELNSTTLDIIENLNSTNILILQGEADIQTPLEQALMLEQKLTELGHLDHTLITYPDLGHTFYPAQGSVQPLGPIREYVLSDLHSWLKDPDRVQ